MDVASIGQLLGNIGEFVGSLGVMLTLIYLAIQVRHTQLSTHSQSLGALEALASPWRQSLASNPQVAELWRRATQDFDALEPNEREQANWLFSDLFWIFQGIVQRAGNDSIDAQSLEMVEENLSAYLVMPGIRQWWPTHRQHFHQDLKEVVEKALLRIYPGKSR